MRHAMIIDTGNELPGRANVNLAGIVGRRVVTLNTMPIRFTFPADVLDGIEIVRPDRPQPDVEIAVAIDGNGETFATAKLKGSTVRKIIHAIREDIAANGKAGVVQFAGRMRSNNVIEDAGLIYMPSGTMLPKLDAPKSVRRAAFEARQGERRCG